MRLYINDKEVELQAGQVIAQTKQVNDLNSINTRNSSTTNIFKLHKTAKNIQVMEYMTLPNNLSLVPYKKNTCRLFADTGECYIFNGWALITDDGTHYEVALIDGIIDFFKSIENKMLSDLDLSELQHQKTVANVLATWSEDKPYKYILADYNGDTGNVNTEPGITPEVNIDYLVPSVNVAWLWNKIFNTYGANYFGSVFDTYNFKELWMTFPKGTTITGDNDHTVFLSNDYQFLSPNTSGFYFAKFNTSIVDELLANFLNIHMQVADTATYRVRVKCNIKGKRGFDPGSGDQNAKIFLGKNSQGSNPNVVSVFKLIGDDIPYGTDFEITSSINFPLDELDTLCVVVTRSTNGVGGFNQVNGYPWTLEFELIRVDPNNVDFSDAFTDFPTKDYINEVIHRFGLTIFKDKASQDYTFLTLKEQLLNAKTVDWSDKFAKKNAENYIQGSYAQRNYFRYNYNDKESSHNDGFIDVQDVNLQDQKDVIKSKIYSPERLMTTYLNEPGMHVYKLWDKEVVENPGVDEEPVKYNPLDKRYYFLRSVQKFGDINVISKKLGTPGSASSYYRESYYKLSFPDILQDYYGPLQNILTRAVIINIDLYLKEIDVADFDFKKLYYFKQLGNYYLMNKINNFIPGKPTKCEMVRVIFGELADPTKAVTIIKVTVANMDIVVDYELSISVQYLSFEYSQNMVAWSSQVFQNNQTQFFFTFPSIGTWYIRIKAGNEYSEIVQLVVPTNQIIIP